MPLRGCKEGECHEMEKPEEILNANYFHMRVFASVIACVCVSVCACESVCNCEQILHTTFLGTKAQQSLFCEEMFNLMDLLKHSFISVIYPRRVFRPDKR